MELTSVIKVLSTFDTHRDISAIRCRLFDLLMLSRNGVDIQSALPTVVKLLAIPDVFVKRTGGEIMIIHCCDNQDIALLAINTLVQDCEDLNPVIRGLSFKIIGNLGINVISDIFTSSVIKGLSDKSYYVRRAAALASIGLNRISSSTILDGDIWDLLYCHLRDEDSMTVVGCLCAIEEICSNEKGAVISNKLGQYLVTNVASFNPTSQRFAIQFLSKFSPKKKSVAFDSLNELDDQLTKSKSMAKILCTMNLFLHLTNNLAHVNQKVYKVAWSSIDKILSAERNEELLTAALDFFNVTEFPVEQYCQDVSRFLCQENDSVQLANQKIRFLSSVVNENNIDAIFGDFLSCVRTLDIVSVKNLAQSVAGIANRKERLRPDCARFLKKLVETKKKEVITEVILVLPSIMMSEKEIWTELISIVQTHHQMITSTQAQIALLQVIRSSPDYFTNIVDIFEHMMTILEQESVNHSCTGIDKDNFIDEDNTGRNSDKEKIHESLNWFKITFLGAATHAFFTSPAKIHPFLSKVIENCIKDSNKCVREKGLFYYSYLLERSKEASSES